MEGDALHQTVTRVYEGLRPEEVRNQERKLRSVGTVDVRLRSSPAPHRLTAQDLVCDRLAWSQRARGLCQMNQALHRTLPQNGLD